MSISAVARVLAGERVERVVAEVLRAHHELDDEARGRLAGRVFGTAVLRARLAFVAHVDIGDARALVNAYVRLEEREEDEEEHDVEVDVTWPTDPLERMCVERSAPTFMVHDLIDALGVEGADAFLVASNVPAPATLRTNTLKTTRDALRARLRVEGIVAQPSPLTRSALVVEGRANLFAVAAWREGWFEVQDASSQVCVELCRAEPGDVVVDLCAGRGGKTLALAASMQNEGALYVHDIDAHALADMQPRLARAGVTCVRPLPAHGAPLADIVLVDAPCSSWGPLRRSPDLRWTQTVAELAALPVVQRALLQRATALVQPGGRVVYATCTVRRAENDDVVAAALADGVLAVAERRTLLPHMEGSDGFFIAVMHRA